MFSLAAIALAVIGEVFPAQPYVVLDLASTFSSNRTARKKRGNVAFCEREYSFSLDIKRLHCVTDFQALGMHAIGFGQKSSTPT